MQTRLVLMLVLSLTSTSACFRDPAALAPLESAAPRTLIVRDQTGASYDPAASPRTPVLVLELGHALAREPPLFLVEGAYSARFASELTVARLRTPASGALALTIEAGDHSLQVRPLAPLAAGSEYSLLWLDGEHSAAFHLTVSRLPSLDARVIASWPSAGDGQVPPNLARALVQFDGPLHAEAARALRLLDADGTRVEAAIDGEPCATLGLGDGACAWLAPRAPLRAGVEYAIVSEPSTALAEAPLRAAFRVAGEPDVRAPEWVAPRCALDEQARDGLCSLADDHSVTLRGSVDEPSLVTLVIAASEGVRTLSTLAHAGEFSIASGALDRSAPALLRLTDLAGNAREQTLVLTPLESLAQLSIDEVRADPRGKEPAQEYVELLNFGPQQVSLMGFSLSTDMFAAGRAIESAPTLAPGERVLVVSPEFEPRDESDGLLPAGVRLARLTAPLPLANTGELLFLRDASGRRVAAGRALAPLVEGQCSVRRAADPRTSERGSFTRDPEGRCTPGAATFDEP